MIFFKPFKKNAIPLQTRCCGVAMEFLAIPDMLMFASRIPNVDSGIVTISVVQALQKQFVCLLLKAYNIPYFWTSLFKVV